MTNSTNLAHYAVTKQSLSTHLSAQYNVQYGVQVLVKPCTVLMLQLIEI